MDKQKLIDDAAFVLDAAGWSLSGTLVDLLVAQLRRSGADTRSVKITAPPEQTQAFLQSGFTLGPDSTTHNGWLWEESADIPTDSLVVEAGKAVGVLTNLAPPRTREGWTAATSDEVAAILESLTPAERAVRAANG